MLVRKPRRPSIWSLAVLLLAVATSAGCQTEISGPSGGLSQLNPFAAASAKEKLPVGSDSMVAIWKPSVYEKLGEPSVRGFGGRFYFYDARNEPVKVAGDLTIYGYDDANEATRESGEADRKFIFESEGLESHYSDSGLGPSYSFWVPWDDVGGEERTITLIPVFKSADGSVPQSKPATMRLPGKRVKQKQPFASSNNKSSTANIALASHVDANKATYVANAGGSPDRGKDSPARRSPTTLRLTKSLGEKLARAENQSQRGTRAMAEAIQNKQSEVVDARDSEPVKKQQTVEIAPSRKSADTASNRVFGQPGSFR